MKKNESMKKYFRFTRLVVFCIIAIILPLSGCDSDDNTGKTGPETQSAEAFAMHIGAILPLTGPAGQYGKWVQQGMEVALDEAAEEFPDVKVKVTYEDSQADPKKAVSAFHKLAGSDVQVVFAVTSGDSLAIAPLSVKYNIPIITGTLVPGITDKSPLLIRNSANMATETKVMAEYLSSQNPMPRVAIIYVNNDVGNFSKDNFVGLYTAKGGEVVGAEAYLPGATDFRAQLTRLAGEQPDVLYFLSYSEWATIEKQARELGMTCDFAGATPTEDVKALKIVGKTAEGTIYTRASFDPNAGDPVLEQFQRRYKKRYGTNAEVWAATFRDDVMLVAKAASQGKGTGNELVKAILAMKVYHGASGRTEFLTNRDTNKPVSIFVIRDGGFQPLQGVQP